MPSASTFDIAKALSLSCMQEYIAYIFSNKTTRITTQSITLSLLQPNPPQLMSSGAMSVQSDPSSIAQSLASSDDDTLENRTLIKRLYNLVDCVVTSPNLNNFINDNIND